MGARFTASEQAFAPILRETAKRGLIFVDDGANPRSVAARIAGAQQSAVRQGRHGRSIRFRLRRRSIMRSGGLK